MMTSLHMFFKYCFPANLSRASQLLPAPGTHKCDKIKKISNPAPISKTSVNLMSSRSTEKYVCDNSQSRLCITITNVININLESIITACLSMISWDKCHSGPVCTMWPTRLYSTVLILIFSVHPCNIHPIRGHLYNRGIASLRSEQPSHETTGRRWFSKSVMAAKQQKIKN